MVNEQRFNNQEDGRPSLPQSWQPDMASATAFEGSGKFSAKECERPSSAKPKQRPSNELQFPSIASWPSSKETKWYIWVDNREISHLNMNHEMLSERQRAYVSCQIYSSLLCRNIKCLMIIFLFLCEIMKFSHDVKQ